MVKHPLQCYHVPSQVVISGIKETLQGHIEENQKNLPMKVSESNILETQMSYQEWLKLLPPLSLCASSEFIYLNTVHIFTPW